MLRQTKPPLIAVVRLRKGNEWVLPKGKLDDGETPRDAAMREVLEETGHDVSVHEFLGTLAYDLGGRSKIVHYWRMETQGRPTRELMNDAFRLKMLMVLALVVLTLVFQTANTREPGYWSASPARRRLGGVLGIASLLLCVSIVAAGRLIAYL